MSMKTATAPASGRPGADEPEDGEDEEQGRHDGPVREAGRDRDHLQGPGLTYTILYCTVLYRTVLYYIREML